MGGFQMKDRNEHVIFNLDCSSAFDLPTFTILNMDVVLCRDAAAGEVAPPLVLPLLAPFPSLSNVPASVEDPFVAWASSLCVATFSDKANTCTVPLSLDTASHSQFLDRAKLWIEAESAPRRNSCGGFRLCCQM